jgi:hypothetical protein
MLGGLVLAGLAFVIFLLRERFPTVMTIIIRTILVLIFVVLLGVVIVMLANGEY